MIGVWNSRLLSIESTGLSRYDGLNLSMEKRYSNRWGMRLSYALGYSRGDTFEQYGTNGISLNGVQTQVLNELNMADNWQPAEHDRKHVLTLSGRTELAGGITLSPIFRYMSANPFTMYNSQLDLDRNGTNWDPLPAGPTPARAPTRSRSSTTAARAAPGRATTSTWTCGSDGGPAPRRGIRSTSTSTSSTCSTARTSSWRRGRTGTRTAATSRATRCCAPAASRGRRTSGSGTASRRRVQSLIGVASSRAPREGASGSFSVRLQRGVAALCRAAMIRDPGSRNRDPPWQARRDPSREANIAGVALLHGAADEMARSMQAEAARSLDFAKRDLQPSRVLR